MAGRTAEGLQVKNRERKDTKAMTYIDETAMYLFNQGVNYESYRMLGAHKKVLADGTEGYLFAVWAPNAKSVSVVCDRNG